MAQQHMIEPETQQFLRGKQGHACLFRCPVAFSLITFYASGDKVRRSTFASLSPRQNVVERQVLCMLVFAAILTAVSITNVNACTFHRRFTAVPADVDVVTQPNYGRHLEYRRRGTQHMLAIVFFDEHGAAKPQAYCPGNANRAKRLIRKV